MSDDYLWDRSGEADPEVERLERVLRGYRYQPRPVSSALISRLPRPGRLWMKLVTAAAALVILGLGLWIFKAHYRNVVNQNQVAGNQDRAKEQNNTEANADNKGPGDLPPTEPLKTSLKPVKVVVGRAQKRHLQPRRPVSVDEPGASSIAGRQPIFIPFVDAETARHLEQAQLLLRAFRNARDSESDAGDDLAYEKHRSRGLLSENILLRRDAEAKGNLPVEEVLGSLEPFLLDIANLPDRPSRDEVRSIKDRIRKKEIVSALQVYSSSTLGQAL